MDTKIIIILRVINGCNSKCGVKKVEKKSQIWHVELMRTEEFTKEDLELLSQINEMPHLRERFKKIIGIARSEYASCTTADQAESKVTEQLRALGNEVLTDWSNSMHNQLEKSIKEKDPELKLREKKKLNWYSTYGEICIRESIWRSSKKAYIRPFKEQIEVRPRGCSLVLQRALVDFGSEESFEKASFRVKEHYGIEVGISVIRRITYHHAGIKAEEEKARPKVSTLKGNGEEQIIAEIDGSMIPMVRIKEGTGRDKRKRREVYWKEARLSVCHAQRKLSKHYSLSFGEIEEAGECWAQSAVKAGWGTKSKIHAIGDGAPWIAQESKRIFGRQGNFTVDLYHVCDYLSLPELKLKWPKLLKRNNPS